MPKAKIWPLRRRWKPARLHSKPPKASLHAAKAKLVHDQALFDYSQNHGSVLRHRDGALRESGNAGTGWHKLEHAGHAAREAFPGRLFRLVIPVPESYVRLHTRG